MANSPTPQEVETARQIVGAVSLSEVRTKIEALDEATWQALQTDLPLWAEFRFENETKFKAGSFETQTDSAQQRMDFRNLFCSTLGFSLFNKAGSKINESSHSVYTSSSTFVDYGF